MVALLVALLATAGMLIKFDKMPGVHLGGAGGFKLGFDSASTSEGGAETGGDDQFMKANELRLGGLSGSPVRRLAIINNRTFDEGEMALLLCGVTNVNVRCVEIRTNSIIVQREDVTGLIELFLGNTKPKFHVAAPGTNVISQTNFPNQAASPESSAPVEASGGSTKTTRQTDTNNSPPVPVGG